MAERWMEENERIPGSLTIDYCFPQTKASINKASVPPLASCVDHVFDGAGSSGSIVLLIYIERKCVCTVYVNTCVCLCVSVCFSPSGAK